MATPFAPEGASPLKLYRKGMPPVWEEIPLSIPKSHGERIAAVPRPWIDRLLADAPPEVDARGGKVSTAMCLGAYESAKTGRRVSLR